LIDLMKTPYDLYHEYRTLSVDLPDGTVVSGIDVHEYRNASLQGDLGVQAGLDDGFKPLSEAVRKHGKRSKHGEYVISLPEADRDACPLFPKIARVKLWPDLQRPFVGKGSPEEVRQVVRLAVHFELVEPYQHALQQYCTDYIGLDCSGFAANYYGGHWLGKNAAAFLAAGQPLASLSELRSGDAMVWADGKHIALIDKVSGNGESQTVSCMVAESTGSCMVPEGPSDGLNYTEYFIELAKPGHLKVYRHLLKARTGFYSPAVRLLRIP
jgi:hypothetical protein